MDRISDLRIIIGMFFGLIGIVLVAASLFGPSDVIVGLNIKGNLWVGSFMIVFATTMILLGLVATGKVARNSKK